MKRFKNTLPLVLLTLIPTLAIWLPFYFRIGSFWNIPLPTRGLETVVANYDGPLYIVVAKTFYNLSQIGQTYQFPLPNEYYAAHFPLFPLLIRLLAGIIKTYPYSMLAITVISSFIALYFFNRLAKEFVGSESALWLTVIFSVFPARWLIVRSIGSPEPLFIGSIIASLFYFRNKKYWLSALWGVVATLTKSPGILLFVAYFLSMIIPKLKTLVTHKFNNWLKTIEIKKYPIILIPIALLSVFLLYQLKFNDFFAYFHSGDNIHLMFPPFQIFNFTAPWVGTFWLEEVIFIYLFGALGVLRLFKMKEPVLGWFAGVFFATTLFVAHRDLMRYSLPLAPILLIAFKDLLVKKEFQIAFIIIIIPIYLFSLAFISGNVMPISNWGPLL
jgi:hypothetical protein